MKAHDLLSATVVFAHRYLALIHVQSLIVSYYHGAEKGAPRVPLGGHQYPHRQFLNFGRRQKIRPSGNSTRRTELNGAVYFRL